METALQIFDNAEFGQLRTLMIDGKIYFVGKDVATILGYAVPRKAIRDHVDDEDKMIVDLNSVPKQNPITDATSEGWIKNEVTVINESGLYSLILSSKLPQAKAFKRWVTADVIPSVMHTGTYSVSVANPNLPLATMMTDIGETSAVMEKFFGVKHGIALAKSIAIAEVKYSMDLATLKELLPPAEHNIGLLNATQVGKKLGISAKNTNKLLCKYGFQIKDGHNYTLTEKGEQFGEMIPYTRNNGHSGYRILWSYAVVDELRRLSETKITLVK